MSSVQSQAPYIAPWATRFNRYSTQIVKLTDQGGGNRGVVVPDGQWWRVVTVYQAITTPADAGDRSLLLAFNTPTQTAGVVVIGMPGAFQGSATVFATWGIGFSPAASGNVAGSYYFQNALPDLLWQQKTSILVEVVTLSTYAFALGWASVEVYTEDYNSDTGALVPATTPIVV